MLYHYTHFMVTVYCFSVQWVLCHKMTCIRCEVKFFRFLYNNNIYFHMYGTLIQSLGVLPGEPPVTRVVFGHCVIIPKENTRL